MRHGAESFTVDIAFEGRAGRENVLEENVYGDDDGEGSDNEKAGVDVDGGCSRVDELGYHYILYCEIINRRKRLQGLRSCCRFKDSRNEIDLCNGKHASECQGERSV